MIFNWFKKTGKHYRVVFPCKFIDGNLGTERLWCVKEKRGYRVDNIPFYVTNIATDDIVSVTKIRGELWYDDIIEFSGNSVIQIFILNGSSKSEVGLVFENLGCCWEGSERTDLIALSVPASLDYAVVKKALEEGAQYERWDFQEACLANSHRQA